MPRITGRGVLLTLVLTAIEAFVLTYWLAVWFPSTVSFTSTQGETNIAVLFIGLFVVNIIAAIANRAA